MKKKLAIKKIYPVLNDKVKSIYNFQCIELEKTFQYPLGGDFFYIDHGINYFSFFEKLGSPVFYGVFDAEKLIGLASGVLRNVRPYKDKNLSQKVWYLCDLKILPEYRGEKLTHQIFKKAFFINYLKCQRAFAISMNPSHGKNHVVKLLERMPYVPISIVETLFIYQIDIIQLKQLAPYFNSFEITNNHGVKDLIIKSSGQLIDLTHLKFQLKSDSSPSTTQLNQNFSLDFSGQLMFCLPSKHQFNSTLKNFKITPAASASILAYRFKSDWDFISTGDI